MRSSTSSVSSIKVSWLSGAQQIIEPYLLAQALDLLDDPRRCAVQDDLVEIARDRIDLVGCEGALDDWPVLRAEIGIENPLRTAARHRRRLAGIAGERREPGHRDVSTLDGEARPVEPLGV